MILCSAVLYKDNGKAGTAAPLLPISSQSDPLTHTHLKLGAQSVVPAARHHSRTCIWCLPGCTEPRHRCQLSNREIRIVGDYDHRCVCALTAACLWNCGLLRPPFRPEGGSQGVLSAAGSVWYSGVTAKKYRSFAFVPPRSVT